MPPRDAEREVLAQFGVKHPSAWFIEKFRSFKTIPQPYLDQWIADLEAPDARQTKGVLCAADGRHCCWGLLARRLPSLTVASTVSSVQTNSDSKARQAFYVRNPGFRDGATTANDQSAQTLANLQAPELRWVDGEVIAKLEMWNDDGFTFLQIARLLRVFGRGED